MSMLNNVMIDVETLSTRPDAVIIQIAAVKFEFKSDKTENFVANCSMKSSIELGLHTDKATLDWWKEQPPEVLKSILKDTIPISDSINQFIDFVSPSKDMVFWANGMNFDYPVIESTCRALDVPVPWKYWNLRDTRTVYSIFGLDWRNYPRIGSYHNAIDDCLTQIKALKECLS